MANLGHVLEESFAEKVLISETIDLDAMKPQHKESAKHRQQNATVVAAIVGVQEIEDVNVRLQDLNELTLTFLSRNAFNYWKGLKNMLHPDNGLSEIWMEEDLHKLKFKKKEEPNPNMNKYFVCSS